VRPSEPLGACSRTPGRRPEWARSLDEVRGAPLILVANELLDCLPARQFVRAATGWTEQVVADRPAPPSAAAGRRGCCPTPARPVCEVSAAQAAWARAWAAAGRDGGAALLIDYGRAEPGFGDTLQASAGPGRSTPSPPGRGRPHRARDFRR
jgi:SAM-dependent MidA family methyltransferase